VVGGGARVAFTAKPPSGPSRVVLGSATASGALSALQTLWVRGDNLTGHAGATADNLVNHGTLRLESADTTWGSAVSGTLTNAADGVVEVGAGSGGGRGLFGTIVNQGEIQVDGGVLLSMTGAFTHQGRIRLSGGSVIAADGAATTFTLDGGGVEGDGLVRVGGSARVVFTGAAPPGPSRLVAGNVTLRGTVPAGQTLWVRGDSSSGHVLATAEDLVSHGTLRLESADSTYESSLRGTFTNAADGLLEVTSGTGGTRNFYGTLVNEGVVRLGAGTRLLVSGSASVLRQDGGRAEGAGHLVVGVSARADFTAKPLSGPSQVVLGNATASGTLHPQQTLWVRGDVPSGHVLATAENLVNHGALRLESADSTYESSLRGTLTNAADGLLEVNAGTGGTRNLYGTLVNEGVVRLGAGTRLLVSGSTSVLTQDGGRAEGAGLLVVGVSARADFTATPLSGPSQVVLGNATASGTLHPQQTLWVRGDVPSGHVLATAENLVNHGTLRLESADSTYESSLRGTLTNAADGLLDVTSGTGGTRSFYGTLDNQGTIVLATGLVASSASVTNAAGGVIRGIGPLTLAGSTLSNAGRIQPGAPLGALVVNGDVSFTAAGGLDVDLGGVGQVDSLQVSGAASLDGALRVGLADGFVPALGQSFEVLTFGSRTGSFASIEVPALGPGARLEASYGTGKLQLTVVPE
jgi:hypothetical protein